MLLAALLAAPAWAAVSVDSAEMTRKDDWVRNNLLSPLRTPPFSFTCGGKPSSALLRSWPRSDTQRTLDAARAEHVMTWTDPASHLVVKCVAVEYRDYPVAEWTVFLKNTGAQDTPILENIQGLDATFQRGGGGEFVLHGIKGDFNSAESYQPFRSVLLPNASRKLAPSPISGQSCDGPDGWPYYNVQMPGGGIIFAIGWPGQWSSFLTRDHATGLHVKAGQELTHLLLRPGEEIRSPLIAMLFWRGQDIVRAQNLWRRWFIAHTLPRVGGQPQGPIKQIQVNGDDTNNVQAFLDAGIMPDLCWRDAGAGAITWYPSEDGPYKESEAWNNTGTWEVDAKKFPNGFKPFSDWIHARGMKFLLWFEPECVGSPTSWLGRHHPEWLLPATPDAPWGAILNLGNPDALSWVINHVDGMIKAQGIDWYREDMNGTGPLPMWRHNAPPNRQGITENFHVQAHLAFWDELKRRNPNLSIDSCASGGRRNDLETMRRAVPLLRSDFQWPDTEENVFEGNQCHTYGLSSWLPFQGSGIGRYDPYSLRSFYLPSFGMGTLAPTNKAAQQRAYAECAKIAPSMLFGDYYPLTPYSLSEDAWIAWQFDRPETGEGCVQAFRRAHNPTPFIMLKLHGLDPSMTYEVENFDNPQKSLFSGKVLMRTGLKVELPPHASAVFHYSSVSPQAVDIKAPELKQWVLKGPLTNPPVRVSDALPLSDQSNHAGWVKFEPMWDEFDGASLDTNKWAVGLPWWQGRQPAWFNPTNVTVHDGQLRLAMRREKLPPELEKLGYSNYTSAALRSVTRSSYGYYEVRAKPMNSAGSSSFWFHKDSAPGWLTEIDVFELTGKSRDFERRYNMTTHVFRTPAVEGHWSVHAEWEAPWRFAGDFHVYGLEWRKDQLLWYVDGVLVRAQENSHWHNPLVLTFDSETMPEWFGMPQDSDLPSTFSIDYVRAWKYPEKP